MIHIGGPGEAHALFSTVLHLVKSGRPETAVPASGCRRAARAAGTTMRVARRLAGLVITVAFAVLLPRWSGAQSFDFQAPPAAADPKTPR